MDVNECEFSRSPKAVRAPLEPPFNTRLTRIENNALLSTPNFNARPSRAPTSEYFASLPLVAMPLTAQTLRQARTKFVVGLRLGSQFNAQE
jgi:hypothetical protein